jgi:transposase
MRGAFLDQGGLFSYISPEARVTANHPLRKIRELVREVLVDMNRSFGTLYASEGRPSIPPEQLLSAVLLQVFYGIRSERQLMEQLNYNLLYRWFVGLSPDDPIWDPTTFNNGDRIRANRRRDFAGDHCRRVESRHKRQQWRRRRRHRNVGMRKTKHRGIRAVATDFLLNLIAYNLIRIPKLVAA